MPKRRPNRFYISAERWDGPAHFTRLEGNAV
jgi:hypothetical protein